MVCDLILLHIVTVTHAQKSQHEICLIYQKILIYSHAQPGGVHENPGLPSLDPSPGVFPLFSGSIVERLSVLYGEPVSSELFGSLLILEVLAVVPPGEFPESLCDRTLCPLWLSQRSTLSLTTMEATPASMTSFHDSISVTHSQKWQLCLFRP